jgi:hypothetical protein
LILIYNYNLRTTLALLKPPFEPQILIGCQYLNLLTTKPKYFVSSLVNMLKGYDIVMKKGLFKKKKEEGNLQDPDELQYIYHDDKSYRVRSYNS